MYQSIITAAQAHGYHARMIRENVNGARLAVVRVTDPRGHKDAASVQSLRELKRWINQ